MDRRKSRSRTLSSKKREKKSSGEASVPRVTRGPCVLVNGGSVGATSVDESATSHCKLLVWPEESPLLGGELLLDLKGCDSGSLGLAPSEFNSSLRRGGGNGRSSSHSELLSDSWSLSLGRGNDGSSSMSVSPPELKSSAKIISRASSVA